MVEEEVLVVASLETRREFPEIDHDMDKKNLKLVVEEGERVLF